MLVNSQNVWALLGLLCLLMMFAMMAAGIRAVRDETFPEIGAPDDEVRPHE